MLPSCSREMVPIEKGSRGALLGCLFIIIYWAVTFIAANAFLSNFARLHSNDTPAPPYRSGNAHLSLNMKDAKRKSKGRELFAGGFTPDEP